MAQLTVLGVSYQTASLCVREKLAFDVSAMLACSQALVCTGLVKAIAIVSTCHRTEFYCDGLCPSRVGEFWAWLQKHRHFPSMEALGDAIYQYTDTSAVHHLLRVSAGLDSLILGETQILGQMKLAYEQALMAKSLGKKLTRLFQFAFGVAKKIRTETSIGENSLSVACIAMRLVTTIFPQHKPLKVMFVGSGEMIAIAARRFQRLNMVNPIFVNRTPEKVMHLAEKFQGEALGLSSIEACLATIDVLVTATSSPYPLIKKECIKQALQNRLTTAPLLLIDLAVPRDIEKEVGAFKEVYLYTVDDLQAMAIDNRQAREEAAVQAEKMVREKARQFMRWLLAQSEMDYIRRYREKCAVIRENTIKEALIQLNNGKSPEVVMQHLAHRLTNRLIHEPTIVLRRSVFKEKSYLDKQEKWKVPEPSVI
ncbi:MAG: Glutamyl-tRNA reductase [Pseudomonadota bacterium]|jgi:glutamyl-tRNA reductase